jgi:periplasmic nitrate reductase NapD
MPIGGVVITVRPGDVDAAQGQLANLTGVEIHGADERGNIVAVFDTRTSEEMEQLMEAVNACSLVLHTGLTFLNMEDVLEDAGNDVSPVCSVLHGAKE